MLAQITSSQQLTSDETDTGTSRLVTVTCKTPGGHRPEVSTATNVGNWSSQQVCDWLMSRGINANERLADLNGVQLVQIYGCLNLAPEYCTASLKTEFGMGFLDVVAFVAALKALLE